MTKSKIAANCKLYMIQREKDVRFKKMRYSEGNGVIDKSC